MEATVQVQGSLPLASVALLSQYPLIDLIILALPQSMLHSFLATCTVIPLLMLLLTTACLCSISWTFKVLLGSLVYTPLQSSQGTWYTILFFFSSGTCDFTLVMTCLKEFAVAKALQMLRRPHSISSLSLSPQM